MTSPERWFEEARVIQWMEAIRADGGVIVLKADGERQSEVWTCVVSQGRMDGETLRLDGDNPEDLLRRAMRRYWGNR